MTVPLYPFFANLLAVPCTGKQPETKEVIRALGPGGQWVQRHNVQTLLVTLNKKDIHFVVMSRHLLVEIRNARTSCRVGHVGRAVA